MENLNLEGQRESQVTWQTLERDIRCPFPLYPLIASLISGTHIRKWVDLWVTWSQTESNPKHCCTSKHTKPYAIVYIVNKTKDPTSIPRVVFLVYGANPIIFNGPTITHRVMLSIWHWALTSMPPYKVSKEPFSHLEAFWVYSASCIFYRLIFTQWVMWSLAHWPPLLPKTPPDVHTDTLNLPGSPGQFKTNSRSPYIIILFMSFSFVSDNELLSETIIFLVKNTAYYSSIISLL